MAVSTSALKHRIFIKIHPRHYMAAKLVHQGARIRLSTDFDGGGLARVVEAEPDVLDCWPYLEDDYRDGFISLRSLEGAGASACAHW